MYDPATGLYHMHYQYHPNHVNWGMKTVQTTKNPTDSLR